MFEGKVEKSRTELTRNGDQFEGFISGLKVGDHYGFRMDGPWQPEMGHLFDVSKLLLDPYAQKLDGPFVYQAALTRRGVDTASLVPKAMVCEAMPDLPMHPIVPPQFIYELGVKSFTKQHPAVPPQKRGTIGALAEPEVLAHLKTLGVDTVELLPINPWIDERHLSALGLHNAWGYNSLNFCAVDPKLCPGGLHELRDTIAALHAAGLQVVLDMVFNHSGESDQFGPTLSFRGLDNASYYAQSHGQLYNDTGCGNTLALNQQPMLDLVLHSLRLFVLKCGVDGFRFDLAPVMGRGPDGFEKSAPLLQAIEADPVLNSRIMIAEPWDVGLGGYQLGQFPQRWLEWNDKYRDDVRRFWRGDRGAANNLATRIAGSSDIFSTRKPSNSVNFIAAHDGFTLRDLVTYSVKDNESNGEGNRDGNASEVTWLGGDVRALLATLFFSRGTIMLTAGDEFGRTQKGNNNAYAQDNETTWLNWAEKDNALCEFTSTLAKLRKDYAWCFADAFLDESKTFWFGSDGQSLDWSNPEVKYLGLLVENEDKRFCIIIDPSQAAPIIPLKSTPNKNWNLAFTSGNANLVSLWLEQQI